MADVIHISDMQYGLRSVIDYVMKAGEEASPRGMKTTEVICPTIIHHTPTDVLAVDINRKMNLRLAALEALQVVGGVSDPRLMVQVAPNTKQFLDGGIFVGAYGPRTVGQVEKVVELLKHDPDSRQAVVSVYDPRYDLYAESKDTPCTLSMQFFIRRGTLVCRTVMRSNDVWWGFTYDIVMFTQLQHAIAAALDLEAGSYIHQPGSLHVYHRDLQAIEELTIPATRGPALGSIGEPGEPWQAISLRARQLIYGGGLFDDRVVNTTTEWLEDQALAWR